MALTDPTDWPGSMPDLRTIDNLLRCSICFEYLNVAMIIPECSHNYCSLCIRRYMKYKRNCPSCNIEVSAAKLCNNRTLDELVRNFVAVRPHILKMCKQEQKSCVPDDDTTEDQVFQVKQSPKRSTTLTGHFTAKKPSRSAPSTSTKELGKSSVSFEELNRSNEENISPKIKPTGSPCNQANRQAVDADVDRKANGPEIDGVVFEGETEQFVASTSSSPAAGPTTPGGSRDKAVCPVCGVPVPTKYINTHLDACLKRTGEIKTRTPKRKPIPPMLWKLVPDKDIRKKLKEHNLSTKGKRYDQVKRLDEFILMYNAQCDSSNPKPGEEIAKEVERLEQLKSQPKLMKEVLVYKLKIEKGHSEDQIQDSQKEYMAAHKSQFGKLVAQARERMNKSKNKSQKIKSLSSQADSSQDTASTATSSSSQDAPQTAEDAQPKDAPIKDNDDVVIIEEDTNEDKIVHQRGNSPILSTDDEDSENEIRTNLVSDGRIAEQKIQDSESQDSEMDTSEGSLQLKSGLLRGFSGGDVQEEDSKILVPSSPSMASTDGLEESPSHQLRQTSENVNAQKSDPTQDAEELLCIPESPMSVVAENRRRKRKQQDCGSNASDSGSSFGDGETMSLRRSKRERKTIK